jgi:hypothetical protein
MDFVVATINSYDSAERFIPTFNVYAFSGYYTLNVKSELVPGSSRENHEAIYNAESQLVDKPGSVIYTSLFLVTERIGTYGQFKRTENYVTKDISQ